MLVTQYNKYITALRKYLGLTTPELNPDIQEALAVSPWVNLILDLAAITSVTHLQDNGALDIHAAQAPGFTCPAGHTAKIKSVYRGTSDGATGVIFYQASTSTFHYLTDQGTAQKVEQINDILMQPTDWIGLTSSGQAGDVAIVFSCAVELRTFTEVA